MMKGKGLFILSLTVPPFNRKELLTDILLLALRSTLDKFTDVDQWYNMLLSQYTLCNILSISKVVV